MDEKRDDARPDMHAQPTETPVERSDVQAQGTDRTEEPSDQPVERGDTPAERRMEEDRPLAAADEPAAGMATPHMPMPAVRQSRTVLVDGATRSDFERRWESVQGEFVDDPSRSVAHAGSLVTDLLERLRSNLSKRGSELGQQGGGDPDTEAMRLELRQYKAIFHTLLHGDDVQPKAPPMPPAPADRRPSAMNG